MAINCKPTSVTYGNLMIWFSQGLDFRGPDPKWNEMNQSNIWKYTQVLQPAPWCYGKIHFVERTQICEPYLIIEKTTTKKKNNKKVKQNKTKKKWNKKQYRHVKLTLFPKTLQRCCQKFGHTVKMLRGNKVYFREVYFRKRSALAVHC